jgi:hypothetical protein
MPQKAVIASLHAQKASKINNGDIMTGFLDEYKSEFKELKEKLKKTNEQLPKRTIKPREELLILSKGAVSLSIEDLIKDGAIKVQEGVSLESALEKTYKKVLESSTPSNKFTSSLSRLTPLINAIQFENKKLLNLYKAASKADVDEKTRAFLLRMSTAIGIASIILLTSYLASKWGIKLPFRMPI